MSMGVVVAVPANWTSFAGEDGQVGEQAGEAAVGVAVLVALAGRLWPGRRVSGWGGDGVVRGRRLLVGEGEGAQAWRRCQTR